MEFSEFNVDPRLFKAVQKMGFERPTPIQASAIPPALTGQDIWGSAETGTGKTAAFLLPLMHRLLEGTAPQAGTSSQADPEAAKEKRAAYAHARGPRGRAPGHPQSNRKVRALVVVPTRELALQVTEHATQVGRYCDLRVTTIYGGVGFEEQSRALRNGIDIIVATPGRLLDHVERRTVALQNVEILVIDEADRMLDVGFLPDLRRIVRLLPAQRQTMLFSATFPAEIISLANEVTRNAAHVSVAKTVTPKAINQALFPVPEHAKLDVLKQLLREEEMRSVLVFARTKHRADRLAEQLQRANIKAGVIHGNRSQGQRVAALEAFRRGRSRVLVATDIAARGIDVEGVSHVINYDLPMQPEDYIHRIGRTGRAEAVGTAYTLTTPTDEDMVRRIQHILKAPIQRRRAEGMPESALTAPPAPPPVRRSFGGGGRRGARPGQPRRFARI